MSLYNGPPRPGARGGRAEFSWENVKADKDREYYLGHSVKATTGRWAKGKDVFWYNKAKEDDGVQRDEIAAVKAREAEMMAEALGMKPKAAKSIKKPALEKHEVDKLLKGAGDEQQAAGLEGERIQGLGFGAGAAVAVREEVHDVLQGTGIPASGRAGPAAIGAGSMMTGEQLVALDAADKRAAKKAEKKAKRKAKKSKKAKKEHKHKKRRHRSSSSDSSSSDSRDEPAQHNRQAQLRGPEEQGRYARHVPHRQHSNSGKLGEGDRGRMLEHDGCGRSGQDQHQPYRDSRQHSRSKSRSPARRALRRSRSRSPTAWRVANREQQQQQRRPPQHRAVAGAGEMGDCRDDSNHHSSWYQHDNSGRRSRSRGRGRSNSRDKQRR